MMKTHRLHIILRNAALAALIFILASEPVLVAAKSLQKEPSSKSLELLLNGGDVYLTSMANAAVQGAGLLQQLQVVQDTPLNQLNESYVKGVIQQALDVAEESSIALGAVDDLAEGIESFGGNLPAAMDVTAATDAGLPDEMRADLVAQGIPSATVEDISGSISTLYLARQSAAASLPADLQQNLLRYGFIQSQIDQITAEVGQRGLVNSSLDTKLAQLQAAQDELADTRSGLVVLAVQLLGYQIALRQADGIQPRALTDAELDELAQDELRLLIHAAHLNALWGNDPNAESGEGDWWFIEHYAARAAERLQGVILDTQNRGLATDLFLAYQMQMLAISARSGDAEYARAELDVLAALLAHRLDATAFYQQHASPGLPEMALARMATIESLREHVSWPVPTGAVKNARLVSLANMDASGVQNLTLLLGGFDESNETNNTGGLIIAAGLEVFNQLALDISLAALDIIAATTPDNVMLWFEAILTGNTDNPALLTANIILSLIPVIGVLPDIITLVIDSSIFIKALSIFGIIGSVGDLIALIPGLQAGGGASFLGDAVSAVVKALFKQAEYVFRAVLDGLKLADAFDVVVDLVTTTIKIVGRSLGGSLDEVITSLRNLLSGNTNLWGNFVAFVRRVGADMLLKLGFDEGSALVGRILNHGMDLSDEVLVVVDDVGDKLVKAGVELTDEGSEGVGVLAKTIDPEQVSKFSDKLLAICGAATYTPSNFKLAKPIFNASSDCVNQVTKIIGELNERAQQGVKKLCNYSGSGELAELTTRHVDDSDKLKGLFGIIGESKHYYWTPDQLDGLERLVFNSSGLSTDAIKYLPVNSLDEALYPGFTDFLESSNYLKDNIYAINSQAKYGYQKEVLGHISQLQGEYREIRFQQYAIDDGQDFLFRHTGPINEDGVDAITKKANNYYWVEVKDRGRGAGIILDGSNYSNNPLAPSNLTKYFTDQGDTFIFNKEYFESQITDMVGSGGISISQYEDLLNAVDDGRLQVMIFAGGTNDPFNSTLKSIRELVNLDSDFSIPFIKIADR
jgi:hypothetical protein